MSKKDDLVFNPWEVKGEINYAKLIKEFGIEPLKQLPDIFDKELAYRRKVIFAHRDIQRILLAIRDKRPFVMMTGLMPTGKCHIGHLMIVKQMIFFQKLGAKIYIAVADLEAYNARGQSLEESRKIAEDYILNYAAMGLNLNKCDLYFQSDRSKDSKKSNAYYRLQNLLARYATFNEFKAVYGAISPGKMLSALLQASDMLHAQLNEFENKQLPVIVPVGIDQDPHLRLARDISQRIKNPVFTQLSSIYTLFMPGLTGGKMSASDPNSYIAPTDNPKEVEMKIKKYAFSGGQPTLEEHRQKGGNPDIDVCFQYLKMMFEEDDDKLKQIETDYRSGKLLTGELKQYTIDKINKFLAQHQKKMEKAKKEINKFVYNIK